MYLSLKTIKMAEEFSKQPVENVMDEKLENVEEDKNTNLHFSAASGVIEIMKRVLESSDQEIDAENFMGWTPLMMAIRNGHIEAVRFLLEKGADITKKNKLGVNCFNLSITNGNPELVALVLHHMLKGGISRSQIQEDLSPISLAIVLKKTHLLRNLIFLGFNLNASTCKTGLTPLMFAAAVSADNIVSILKIKGVNTEAKNYMGVNYQDILQWRRHGLENMRNVTRPKLTLFPIKIRQKSTASAKENLGVNQETCEATEYNNFNKDENNSDHENDQNRMNIMEGHFSPLKRTKPHRVTSEKIKKYKYLPQTVMRSDNQSTHHSFRHNVIRPYPYYPTMNSPSMVPSPYLNFTPQNLVMPLQDQNQCGLPGPSIFFAKPDPNFACDSANSNLDPYCSSQMFYVVYPNVPNVFSSPGPKP